MIAADTTRTLRSKFSTAQSAALKVPLCFKTASSGLLSNHSMQNQSKLSRVLKTVKAAVRSDTHHLKRYKDNKKSLKDKVPQCCCLLLPLLLFLTAFHPTATKTKCWTTSPAPQLV